MTIRTRKFFGTIALLVLVVVWSLLGMTMAQTPWLANSGLLQAIFYVVAGIGWVLPAMPIISWMSRPDRLVNSARPSSSRVGLHRRETSTPDSITRIMRSERCRPSQAMRGSACRLVSPLGLDHARDRRHRAGETRLLRPSPHAAGARMSRSPNG